MSDGKILRRSETTLIFRCLMLLKFLKKSSQVTSKNLKILYECMNINITGFLIGKYTNGKCRNHTMSVRVLLRNIRTAS